jgi:hypothetical protein
MAAAFVAAIVVVAVVFMWLIADTRGFDLLLVALFTLTVGVGAVLVVRRMIRKGSGAEPGPRDTAPH